MRDAADVRLMRKTMNNPMPTLDLVVIARDEARCLARCLRSARPWVDSMVVLDTGSSDDTVQIALSEGARVYHFDWGDDFAAARNAALAHSRAEWRLVLDADEWLIDGAQALHTMLMDRGASRPWVGVVAVESECEDAANGAMAGIAVNRISRLLPRGASYAGRIHEQVQAPWPRRDLSLRIGHDGYRPELLQRKQGRNQRLLQLALQEAPDNAYLHYQWGKEAESAGLHAQAAEGYARAAQAGATGTPWALDLVVRQLHCLSMAGAHEAAVSLAGDSAEQWSHAVDFHFVVGTLMLNWACAQPQRAAECLPIAHASWQQCLALGDDARHDGAVRGRGGHLAAWNLMALHEGLGDAARATEYRELAQILRSSPHPAQPLAPGSSSAEGTRSIDTRVPAPATRTRATH